MKIIKIDKNNFTKDEVDLIVDFLEAREGSSFAD